MLTDDVSTLIQIGFSPPPNPERDSMELLVPQPQLYHTFVMLMESSVAPNHIPCYFVAYCPNEVHLLQSLVPDSLRRRWGYSRNNSRAEMLFSICTIRAGDSLVGASRNMCT